MVVQSPADKKLKLWLVKGWQLILILSGDWPFIPHNKLCFSKLWNTTNKIWIRHWIEYLSCKCYYWKWISLELEVETGFWTEGKRMQGSVRLTAFWNNMSQIQLWLSQAEGKYWIRNGCFMNTVCSCCWDFKNGKINCILLLPGCAVLRGMLTDLLPLYPPSNTTHNSNVCGNWSSGII